MNVLNELFASTVYIMYILLCICVFICFKFNAFYMFMGLRQPGLLDVVASSPSSKGWGRDKTSTCEDDG